MTTQPDLFADDRYVPPVRRSDPPTSHAGAAHIAPRLGRLKARMLSVFAARPATANEAAAACVRAAGGNHESLRKRTGELESAGLIEVIGERTCSVTGQPASVFAVKMPQNAG